MRTQLILTRTNTLALTIISSVTTHRRTWMHPSSLHAYVHCRKGRKIREFALGRQKCGRNEVLGVKQDSVAAKNDAHGEKVLRQYVCCLC